MIVVGYVVEMLMTQISVRASWQLSNVSHSTLLTVWKNSTTRRMNIVKISLLLLACFADLGISIRLIYPPERFPFFDFAPLSDISSSCDFSHFEKVYTNVNG
ncbi:conserved hypothetical protein [Trichinella spiralis]|uniref:hypothetical protein n=1 Tax=Trichinella spiralis TaxID=6334 RepID=UPI0001EFE4A0|nr:conserved hypothetical protein [Trichinella spiralis]